MPKAKTELPSARRERGRPPNIKAAKRDISTDDMRSVSSFNSYSVLPDDDDGMSSTLFNLPGLALVPKPVSKTNHRPPHILSPNMTDPEVGQRLSSLRHQHPISRRLTKEGVKLYTATFEDFNCVRPHLTLTKTPYIAYALPEQQLFRFVLYGLPDTNLDTVKAAINEQLQFNPVDMKKMFVKDPKYPRQSNYIEYFSQTSNIRGTDLKTIRHINGYHVLWSAYRKTDGPTVCRNCGRFKHSAVGCGLAPRYVRCGEGHHRN